MDLVIQIKLPSFSHGSRVKQIYRCRACPVLPAVYGSRLEFWLAFTGSAAIGEQQPRFCTLIERVRYRQ